jgi:hypothetical protein
MSPHRFSLLFPSIALVLLQSCYAHAVQHGLPHEVFNVTQTGSSLVDPVTEPSTVTLTTTQSWTTTQQCPTPSSTRTTYTSVIPSPNAPPIEITTQSQILTSYMPQMTWCVGPPMAISALPGASDASTTDYTTIIDGTGSCSTQYTPVTTTVCATTLTGLASRVTITDCDQEVTFSTECSFMLETPTPTTESSSLITPAPTVKQVFTYWLAPWQSLTGGETPSDVDVKICTALGDGKFECTRHQEVWEVVLVTKTLTTTRSIGFTATVTGPGTLIIETIQAFITNTTKFIDLSTTLLLETLIETESTSVARKTPTGSSLLPEASVSTLYVTKTLQHKTIRYARPAIDYNINTNYQQYRH